MQMEHSAAEIQGEAWPIPGIGKPWPGCYQKVHGNQLIRTGTPVKCLNCILSVVGSHHRNLSRGLQDRFTFLSNSVWGGEWIIGDHEWMQEDQLSMPGLSKQGGRFLQFEWEEEQLGARPLDHGSEGHCHCCSQSQGHTLGYWASKLTSLQPCMPIASVLLLFIIFVLMHFSDSI